MVNKMSNLSKFMKQNKVVKENKMYAVTKSLRDENGNPVEWEIRPLTPDEVSAIRKDCTTEIPINVRKGMYRPKVDGEKLSKRLVVESIVEPNLYSTELQDSYGVKKPEDLLSKLVDSPGEFNNLIAFVQEFNDLNTDFEDKVEHVKN